MGIISNALRRFLSLSLVFALAGCAALNPFHEPGPEELLFFSWRCDQQVAPGPYSVHMNVYGSGDLAGTLGNTQLHGGASPTATAGQCPDIAAEAVHIANSLGCQTSRIVEGTDVAAFSGYCIGPRTKLITVMDRLLRHAQTFAVTTP
jgi:hypothetical protein